jgi:2-amino-4-hydroxy-6-hydroxymethyldihydropteridine diphosphokinase
LTEWKKPALPGSGRARKVAVQTLCFIGIGSNVGDRLGFCQQAIRAMASKDIAVRSVSSLYETEPVDYLEQGWFYNAVAAVETSLSPRALLTRCQEIERQCCKNIVIPKGPRTLDLDILFYGDQSIHEPGLTVPHPSAMERPFVLIPMAEIAPDFIPPTETRTIKAILGAISGGGGVKKGFDPTWTKRV